MITKITIIFFLLSTVSFSQTTESTIVVPTMDSKFEKGKNLIYCSSLELLWLKIYQSLKEKPEFQNKTQLVKNLNKAIKNYQVPLESNYWLAEFGNVKQGVLDSIKNAYKEKFNIDWEPRDLDGDNFYGHCYLKKDILFYSRLSDDFYNLYFNDSIKVKSFGVDGGWQNPTYKKKIKIFDYVDKDNFIVQVGCKDTLDEIFFAKVNPSNLVWLTFENVMYRVAKGNESYLEEFDKLKLPYLKFDIEKEYTEVTNNSFLNKELLGSKVEFLTQKISFDLTMDGVKIESEASVIIEFGLSSDQIKPKIYSFDKPFLIIVKRKTAKKPYLLFWVENTEFMTKTGRNY